MSAITPIFIAVVLGIVAFILFMIAALALYSRGKVVRIYADIVSYFRMKETLPMRLRLHKELIETLSSEIKDVFDKIIFKDPKAEKKVKNSGVDDEMFDWWVKAREDPSSFKIWCYRFTRPWRYLGVKGRTVYAFCIFSLEEMIKKRGRKDTIDGVFQENPIVRHDPSLEKFTQRQIEKSEFKLDDKQLKNIVKNFKFWGEEPYLATIFTPTSLSISEKSELKQRLTNFNNRFKTVLLGLRVFGTELVEYQTMKYAMDNIIEARRLFEKELHTLKEILGRKSKQYRNLETINKMLTVSVNVNPNTPLPTSGFHPPVKEKTIFTAAKEKAKAPFSGVEFFNYCMLFFGVVFTFATFVSCLFNATNWGIFLIATLIMITAVGLLNWRKRYEPSPVKKPEKPEEGGEINK